ncbi:Na-translocating system protein MpsC family protein [Patulibacter sp. S7RM1-6]
MRGADTEGLEASPNAAPMMQVSNAVAAIYKEHFGKGPESAKSTYAAGVVTSVLRGGFSVVERTLGANDGRDAVRAQRQSLDDLLAPLMKETIGRIMNRRVVALLSAVHQNPDMTVHVFVLADD